MAKKNSSEKKVIKQYLNLFYMTPELVNAKGICEVLKGMENIKVELWEELNVMEIELASGNTVDFESMKPEFKDPSDMSFVKNRNIQTIFAVTCCEDDIAAMTECFDIIVDELDGFLCTDSDDFRPVYVQSVEKE